MTGYTRLRFRANLNLGSGNATGQRGLVSFIGLKNHRSVLLKKLIVISHFHQLLFLLFLLCLQLAGLHDGLHLAPVSQSTLRFTTLHFLIRMHLLPELVRKCRLYSGVNASRNRILLSYVYL